MNWKFNWKKPIFVLISAAVVVLIIYFIDIDNIFVDLLCKLAVVGVFIVGLIVTKLISINYIMRVFKSFRKKRGTVE